MNLPKPTFSHITPDSEAFPIAKFAVESLDLFILANTSVIVRFVELSAQPRIQGEAVKPSSESPETGA